MRDLVILITGVLALAVGCAAGRGLVESTASQLPIHADRFPGLLERKFYLRAERFHAQRAAPSGRIPRDARARAVAVAHALATSQPPIPPSEQWLPMGPSPMTLGGPQKQVSGRVSAIAVDPTNPRRWLIGGAQGGIWETLDGGTTWAAKTDNQRSLAMGAIAFAPSAPATIYAGTGEANFWSFTYGGAGLLKTMDNGASWSLIAQAVFDGNAVSSIQVDPIDPNRLLVASIAGNFGRQTAGEHLPNAPFSGVFKSTDGGRTWARKLPARHGTEVVVDADATDLKAQPGTFTNMYAGLGNQNQTVQNGLYRSRDAGETWTRVSGPWEIAPGPISGSGGTPPTLIGRIALAFAPSRPDTLYVGIQQAYYPGEVVTTDDPQGILLGLWRTDNAFDATPLWQKIVTDYPTGVNYGYRAQITGYCGTQCSYDHVLSVDPEDAETLYAGGVGLWRCSPCNGQATIANWRNIIETRVHVDTHALTWIVAGNEAKKTLIVGNDGGVWSTANPTDIGAWRNHNAGLALTQFYYGAADAYDPSILIGGSEDNGTSVRTAGGGNVWATVGCCDGSDNAISRQNTDHQVLSPQGLTSIVRTTDAWKTSTRVLDKNEHVPDTIGRSVYYTPFALCPSNENFFIVGTANLLAATDFFASGPKVPNWTPNFAPNIVAYGVPTAVAFSPADPSCATYALATTKSQIWITATGGGTAASSWRRIDASTLPSRYPTAVAFDPTTSNTLYVTYSGFNAYTPGTPGHVFKTTDALAAAPTWTKITTPMDFPHNAIAVDPTRPSTVYVGTDYGLFRSTTGGMGEHAWRWMGSNHGLPNAAVYDVEINLNGVALAFTFGRSAWMLQTGVPAPTIDTVVPSTGAAAGGTPVTITGTGFRTSTGATTFTFGSARATGVNCTSETTCTATTPAGAGTVTVGVSVLRQTGALLTGFTYENTGGKKP